MGTRREEWERGNQRREVGEGGEKRREVGVRRNARGKEEGSGWEGKRETRGEGEKRRIMRSETRGDG